MRRKGEAGPGGTRGKGKKGRVWRREGSASYFKVAQGPGSRSAWFVPAKVPYRAAWHSFAHDNTSLFYVLLCRVNCVAPGWVDTPMIHSGQDWAPAVERMLRGPQLEVKGASKKTAELAPSGKQEKTDARA